MTVAEITFWISLALLVYAYAGYPLLMALLARLAARPESIQDYRPRLTLIIPAHNEERWIRQKIENTLQLNYPRELLQIVVASDGSTDRTVEIVREFDGHRVEVAAFAERHGKQDMLNLLVPQARGDIVVMTDTHVLLDPESVRLLVAHFADSRVGCVTGQRRCILQPGVPQGAAEGLYWRYESWIKRSESRLHSCLGAHGQLYAVRRSAFPHVEKVGEDFYIPMKIVASTGLRALFEPRAICYTPAAANLSVEFERKTRAHVSFLLTLPMLPELLLPWKSRLWWQYISHHVLRMLVPIAMLAMLGSSLVAASASSPFLFIVFAQGLFYLAAAAGLLLARHNIRIKPFYIPFYFVFANLAIARALLRWPRKKYEYAWERTERMPISG